VQIIRATLSCLLGDAVEDGLVAVNVVQRLNARKKRHRASKVTKADRAKQIRPLTLQDLGALLEAAQGREHEHVLFLTLADTGMRPGEVLALRWTDLNIGDQTIHVERAVTVGGAIKGTKTDTDRHVELTPRLTEALRQWHTASQVEALAAGRELGPWIFPSPTGSTLRVQTVSKRFRRLRGQAKIAGHHRLYDLRHTYASHALALGAPITYVAAQLGHSTPAITLSVYSRWIPRSDRLWAKRLQESREFHTVIHTTPDHALEQPALTASV
jgi:integrase